MLIGDRRSTAALLVAGLATLACEPTNQGFEPAQPIEYSHAIHAGSMKIPCMYCHYAAEDSRHAGIPPAQFCMNCHEQVKKDSPEIAKVSKAIETGAPIAWVRVHSVPDHVYFNHSVHVRSNVACQDCHGPIESMSRVRQWAPLTMGWCISCHRAKSPIPEGMPDDTVVRASALTDCGVCHH